MKLELLHKIALWGSFIGIIDFLLDFGFSQSNFEQQIIDNVYFTVIGIGLLSTFARYVGKRNFSRKKVFLFDFLSVLFTLYVCYMYIFVGKAFESDLALENPVWIVVAVILTFIREVSEIKIRYYQKVFNPAQLFILSFFLIILIGSMLLMLPKATYSGISFHDALFTATSAVCVTGLIVVDTGSFFTPFGQAIILLLIQIGGLGILTFASYFSFFFKGGATYENQISLGEMINTQKMGEVFGTLKNIILITVVFELSSALLIYLSLDETLFPSFGEKAFFSVFHAISAFCNAGFSTLPNSAYEMSYRFNYPFQLILIATLIFGGLGFPIVSNITTYLKQKISRLFQFGVKQKKYRPWVLNINSRITLITTLSLTIIGFVFFFILEYDHTLAEHSLFGKIVTALFGATTPRTAGFNSVDMAGLALPTVILTIFLMWIGASPASTGGGIKTNTFAVAVLNILSLAKGKDRIEIYRREIANISLRRAAATIILSLIVIAWGIFMMSVFDPEKGLLNLAFECFSAYSTVGLSLGITGSLSAGSKSILIIIMFVGRVSTLSVMVALFKKTKHKNYRYPTEEIIIN